MISFLTDNIIVGFGVPESIVCDNAKYFSSSKLTEFALQHGIKFKYSANYYPQGNGLAMSTNEDLLNIIKNIVAQNQHCWHSKLSFSLWADKVTPKA